jgi:hypothetical protein
MTKEDSTMNLELDEFPHDPNEWKDTDGDGIGDNSDEFPDDPSMSTCNYYDESLNTIKDWLDSQDPAEDAEVDEDVYFPNDYIYEITITVHIEDFDEAHNETDNGSDPDQVRITVSDGDQLTQESEDVWAPSTVTFWFRADSTDPDDLLCVFWIVTIQGLEFGGGKKVYGPFGFIIYVDQGVEYTIDVEYTYLEYE